MKKILLIIITFVALGKFSYTQNSDSTSLSFNEDSILKKIITLLPEGWNSSIKKDSLIFERLDTTWILAKNQSDSSNKQETRTEKNERIKKNGVITKSHIILKYEPKWNYEKKLSVKNCNTVLSQEIQKLPGKYNIVQLYNSTLSTRGNPVYTGITPKEKNQIAKYENEKNELQSKIVTLPDYNSEKYSFFIKSMSGYNDNTHDIYPEEASLQFFQILTLFFEYAGQ